MASVKKLQPLTIKTTKQLVGKKGIITSDIAKGEIFFKSETNKSYRLLWDKGKLTSKKRALPVGQYKFMGYRIIRDKWMISTTSPGHQSVFLSVNKREHINVDPSIYLKLKVKRHHGKLRVVAGIQGEKHRGLSIYRNGKRIPLFYIVENRQKKRLASGKLNYG